MNQQNILVSIIVPNYNCLEFLPSCLESIDQQHQTFKEIIFIDDDSTDGSRGYLEALTHQRDDVTVILESGVGPGAARNIGVQLARGDYLAFLDADDGWTPNKLAKQLAFMLSDPSLVLTFTNYEHVKNENGQTIIPCFDFWPEFNHQLKRSSHSTNYRLLANATSALFKENVVGTSSVMCRKDAFIAVGGFDTTLPSASDWDLWLKLSKVGGVGFTTEVNMNYLVREGSVSRNLSKRIAAMESIAARHVGDAQQECTNAQRFIDERLMDAYCEMFDSDKAYWQRLAKHTQTLVSYPSVRRLKSMVKSAIRFH